MDNTELEELTPAHERRGGSYIRMMREVVKRYAEGWELALMGVGSVAALVDGLTLPAMILIQSRLIHNFHTLHDSPTHLVAAISQSCLLFTYVALISWVASCLEVSCWMRVGESLSTRIRAKYLQAVLRQDATFFECEMSTATVIDSISMDTALLQDAISEKVGNFVKNVAHFAGGYMVAFFQIWRIALLMIPFTPFLLLPGFFYSKSISGLALEIRTSYEKANTIAEQALSSIRTVYAFVAEERVIKSYSEALKRFDELGRKQGFIKGLAVGSNGLIFTVWAFLGWYGATLIASGEANGGQVLTTGFAVMTGGLALGNAFCHVKVFSDGCSAAHKIFQIIDRVPSIDTDSTDGKILEAVEGKVELQNVSFAYSSRVGVPVLKNLSLEFCPGKTVALVGNTGSGKSTIISLIQRFYDPLSGAVLLDGFNIKELHLKWVRQIMGLVSQEPALFATSIMNNLRYGKDHASMDEIIAAATLSGAHNFIMKLPNGYDTQVGERGVQMSGGQKQRIAIARAVLRNPIVLLLDEATSALDAESEASVNQALRKASWGRTTILVAHRISTIKSADTVVVLQNGLVVEILKAKDLLDSVGNTSNGLSAVLSKMHQNEPQNDNSKQIPKEHNTKDCDQYPDEESESLSEQTKTNNKKGQKTYFWKLLCLSRSEWKQGLWGLLGALGYGMIQPIYAYLLGELASIYYWENLEKREQQIRICSLLFACLSISFLVVNLVQHYSFFVMGERLTRQFREKMISKFFTFEVGWFDEDENCSGALCSRLASDANTVKSLLTDRISLLVQTAFTVLVSAIIALTTSWRLALVMIAIQPVVIHAYFYRNRSLAEFAKQEAYARQEAGQLAGEAVSMQKTVASFCMQEQILSRFESKLEKTKKKMSKQSYQAGMGIGIAQFILFASWALDFWYGGQLVKSHKATARDVFKTFYVLVSTGRMLAEAGMLTPDVAKGSAALQSIFSILDRDTQIDPENQEGEKVEVIKGDIDLKNVSFCYPSRPEVMIFHNFNLQVMAGTSVALVGPSGSGKSTIVGLIERFYDPMRGQVTIDGADIRSMHLRTLRQHIGLVNQEPSLFATTIRENILCGKPDSSEDEVIKAACAANAHSFISALPEGYSTSVGNLGLQLSGGQKQRIAIARAILKNPRILLLDEATSALDCNTERQVQDALNAVMVGRTSLIIAHRFSSIQQAHCIAVMHDGSIVEQGTHSQLLTKGPAGAYFNLFHSQIAGPLS